MQRFQTQGPKFGRCGICSEPSSLTEDHIPPTGVNRISQQEMMHIVNFLSAEPSTKANRVSQNGVKFRSLCRKCNNDRLGIHSDPYLIELVDQMNGLLRSPAPQTLYVPNLRTLTVHPQRVLRAVIGHVLAFGVDRIPEGPFDEAIAEYFLNSVLNPPSKLKCYYWPYPYNDQLVIRDAVRMERGENILFKLMKFYPISFLLTWYKPSTFNPDIPDLCSYAGANINHLADVPIYLSPMQPRRWPEAPNAPQTIVFYGKDAMYSKKYR